MQERRESSASSINLSPKDENPEILHIITNKNPNNDEKINETIENLISLRSTSFNNPKEKECIALTQKAISIVESKFPLSPENSRNLFNII